MPIEVGIWRLGDKVEQVEQVEFSALEAESTLEDTLVADLSILSANLMLVGRQVTTVTGKFIDLLAMDSDGDLVVIELKRGRTPREVVAQILDYASWVQDLSYDDIKAIYAEKNNGKELEEGFDDAFGTSLPEELNQNHRLVVVASELDFSSERIINYLGDNYGVPINVVFFRHFKDGDHEYLTRTWLIDPQQPEKTPRTKVAKKSEPWNGRDFYVTLGEGDQEYRSWEDCQRYGFISAGGGKRFSQPLDSLFPGARIFVLIPKRGYVGVGTVKESSVPVKDFTATVDGKEMPILELPTEATNMGQDVDDAELCQYLVRVEWVKTNPREGAHWKKGLFANQATCCRLRSRFTLERLVRHFGLDE